MARGSRSGWKSSPRRIAAAAALCLVAAACATAPPPAPPPARNVFILLPEEQGRTGLLVVSGAGTERRLDAPGQAVRVDPGSPPGEPFLMSPAEIDALFGPALKALPAPPAQFLLYFEKDSTSLTRESAARLPEIVGAIRDRASVDVSVVGHADTLGDRRHNDRLALKRAQAVGARLAAEGVDSSILEIASHGKDNPLVPTADQVAEPRNRRVEVTVR